MARRSTAGLRTWPSPCPPRALDSWFAHVAIAVPAEGASNEWLEPVSDEEYAAL
ncbi:hypothetical protein [Eggerthella sinensis]|uniref:hypothetical protein n=1 Tax=Eggerthella sinensis TaxID=242230 RepID=UPI0022E0D0E1|nr:hypothetical protein [Eggerthella sinensis]